MTLQPVTPEQIAQLEELGMTLRFDDVDTLVISFSNGLEEIWLGVEGKAEDYCGQELLILGGRVWIRAGDRES